MLTAQQGVIGLLGYVLAVDATAKPGEQITDWFRATTRRHPILMRLGIALIALHLSADLPPRADPVSGIGWLLAHIKP